MQAQMAAAQRSMGTPANLQTYKKQMAAMRSYARGFNEMAIASGNWHVESVKTISSTERLTKAISDQKLTLNQALRQVKLFKQAWREQAALQRAQVMQWTSSATGRNNADVYIPKGLDKGLDNARVKYGLINQAIGSIAHQTVNWGKNTQWAGRQITVGIGMPLAIAAAGMAKLAYDADYQLTRLAKVYDTAASSIQNTQLRQIATEQELAAVRKAAMQDASTLAHTYGQSLTDTLELEADLAAIGLTGNELRQRVTATTRIATLGELDHQTALDASIALTQAYKMSVTELGDAFNYMNALENATSLATKDFAEAIPRVAGLMHDLGVSFEQFGIFMTAFSQGGVDPGEGANALKSAATRLIDPTKEAVESFEQENIHLLQIVDDAAGNVYEMLTNISKAVSGLEPDKRFALLADLFGTYQVGRLNTLINGLADGANGIGQVATAMRIAGQATSEWGVIADQELERFQKSASGKFKRAVEGMKADLASMGEALLPALTWAIEKISALVKWFNELPDGAKKFIGITALIAGLAGPVIMLLGLFANLTGNLFKAAAATSNLFLRFKALTPQQVAEARLARAAAQGFDMQANSAANLTLQLQKLLLTMERQQAQATRQALGVRVGVLPGMNAWAMGKGAGSNQQMTLAAAQAAAMADDAAKTKRSFASVAGSAAALGVGVYAMQSMLDSSGGFLDNMINAALVIGTFSSLGIGGLFKSITKAPGMMMAGLRVVGKQMGFLGNLVGVMAKTKLTGLVSGLSSAVGLFGKIRFLALGVFGPLGLLAGAVAIIATVVSGLDDVAERQQEINQSTSAWAEILDYTETAITGPADENSDTYASRIDDVDKLREANEGLVDALVEAKNAGGDFGRLYDLALQEALKVVTSGGTASQARSAFLVSLQAAGLDEMTMRRLSLKFDQVDLSDPDSIREKLRQQIDKILNEIPTDISSGGFLWMDELFGDGLTDAAGEGARKAGRLFASQFNSASGDLATQSKMFSGLQDALETQFVGKWRRAFDTLSDDAKQQLRDIGVTGIDSFMNAMKEGKIDASFIRNLGSDEFDTILDEYSNFIKAFIEEFGAAAGLSEDEINRLANGWANVGSVAERYGAVVRSVHDAQEAYTEAVSRGAMSWAGMTDEQKLAILNQYRLSAGLEAATHWTQGFGDAADGASADVANLSNAMEDATMTGDQLAGALQSAMSNTMNFAYQQASSLLDIQNQAQLDAIQAGGDARIKALEGQGEREDKLFDARDKALQKSQRDAQRAFDAAWDRREKTEEARFDSKINRLQKEIDAEKNADDERQRIFEAQQRRIERMASMFNANVDFNAALNSGNLDEAARLYNSSSAQTQQWSLDDAQRSAEEASQKRQDALQAEIDRVEKAKDARMEALKAVREAETDAFNARQEEQQEALRMERENAQKALEANKERIRAQTEAAAKGAAEEQKLNRLKLEAELLELQAFIPRNETELWEHIGRVEDTYAAFGVDLTRFGDNWADIIATYLHNNIDAAAVGLQNEINWAAIGRTIADQIGDGTGISFDQVKAFLSSGKWPTGVAPNPSPYAGNPLATPAQAQRQRNFSPFHSGGMIPHTGGRTSQRARTGVPRSASPYPSEVPILSKAGEFIVEKAAATKHRALLEAINQDRLGNLAGGRAAHSFHEGGFVDHMTAMTGLHGAVLAKIQEAAVVEFVKQEQARQAAIAAAQAASMAPGMIGPLGGGGAAGTGVFNTSNRNWPAPQLGVVSSNTAAAVNFVRSQWPQITSIGTLGSRPNYSDHPLGKAADFMIPSWNTSSGISLGSSIASWFASNPNAFGTKYLIWRKMIAEDGGRGWQPYSHPTGGSNPTLDHFDHVHLSLYHIGGMVEKLKESLGGLTGGIPMPQLSRGGFITRDGMAMLHEDEAVMTKPLTDGFKANLASGGGNEYTVNIEFSGPVNADVDVEKVVYRTLDKIQNKRGRARSIR